MRENSSLRRYGLLIVKYMREQYRTQILMFALTLLIFIGIRVIGNLFTYAMSTGRTEHDEAMGISLIMQYAYMLCAAGLLFAYQTAHCMPYMKNRVQHIAYLMIPASNGEKFAAAVTISYVLPTVYTFLALHLSNLAQLPFTGEWMSMSQEFTGMFSELVRTEPQISEWIMRFVTGLAVYCAVSIVFSGGWYTASATLFRRHPFLLGSVILYLAGQVAGFALIFGNFSLFNNAEADPAGMMGLMTNYFYVLSAIYAVLTPALYVFAYRRMKSAEV